jgi:hypothetical protein
MKKVPTTNPNLAQGGWYVRLRRMASAALGAWRATDPEGIGELSELYSLNDGAEVVAFFGDDVHRIYQIEQWINVFEKLNEKHKVHIICRQHPVTTYLRTKTKLPIFSIYDFFTLTDAIIEKNYKVILYVNNSSMNFQTLAAKKSFHVHLNHGESDKMSMTSRQMYAYDFVAVAGQAAKDRLKNSLMVADDSKEWVIGRPQLDLLIEPLAVDKSRKILIYAPTWQGDQEANNYSSLDIYGKKIIKALLDQPNATVIYKPHPRIVENKISERKKHHQQILKLIDEANAKNPTANHQFLTGDPMPVLQVADLLIADVSSVTTDYLYLQPNGVLFICDRRTNTSLFNQVAPVSKAIPIIDSSNIAELSGLVKEYLVNYPRRDEYNQIRTYYFGEGGPGASLNRFTQMVTDLIQRRDDRVAQMPDLM